MALQSEAIKHRLEGLKQDDRRTMFDSKLRAFRLDSKSSTQNGNRTSRQTKKDAPDFSAEHMIAMLEELSRMIDELERKNRATSEEMRQRDRRDQIFRSVVGGVGVVFAAIFLARWLMCWL